MKMHFGPMSHSGIWHTWNWGIPTHTVLFYINVNRKKIFLVLCVFIMGTWIGSSFPYYQIARHIPMLCNRVEGDTSARMSQPQSNLNSAHLGSSNNIPTNRYAASKTNTKTSFISRSHSQGRSRPRAPKDGLSTRVSTQLPTKEMRPTSRVSTQLPTRKMRPTSRGTFVPTVGTSKTDSGEHSAHTTSSRPRKYLVDTSTCKIPWFHPRDPSLKDIIDEVKPLDCGRPPLTFTEGNVLRINEEVSIKHYGARSLSDVICCYRSVKRQKGEVASDDDYVISKGCFPFVDKTRITEEFVKVECDIVNINGSTIVDFHFTVPSDFRGKKRRPTSTVSSISKDRPFSVMMLGFDAVSRLNFERHLNRTRKFLLETLHAVELYGYNKVGANTFPNLVPVLTGLNESELTALCWPKELDPLDDCPWIWKLFEGKGYQTMYGEDSTSISTFNYLKSGFHNKPTGFYLRPFLMAAESAIASVTNLNTNLCLGPRPLYQVTFQWAYELMRTFSNWPYFGLIWSNSLTHDDEDFLQRADPFLSDMLQHLHESKKLEDTFVIFLSDHGIRWGDLQQTLIGRYEERLPVLFIVPPTRFRQTYPGAYEALRRNSRRLTSPFDLHETLMDILMLPNSTDNVRFSYPARGLSLFEEVPENRSCGDAGINPHWCACNETISLDVDSAEVVSSAQFIVSTINDITMPLRDRCEELHLDKVLGARRITNVQMHEDERNDFYYVVVLRTMPGASMFEATVRTTKEIHVVEGDISRVNLYAGSRDCISSVRHKKFCFCKPVS